MAYINAMKSIGTHACALLILICAFPVVATSEAERIIGAAEQALSVGNEQRAQSLLASIRPGSLDARQIGRMQVVRAEISLRRGDPDAVLRALPPSTHHLPTLFSVIERQRAQALFQTGETIAAVETLIARERRLRDAQQIRGNQELIWQGLIGTPLDPRTLTDLNRRDPMVAGWLELARILALGAAPNLIQDWIRRYPTHPGVARANRVRSSNQNPIAQYRPGANTPAPGAYEGTARGGIALLVPLSGGLGGAGEALREGFVSAWFQSAEPRPRLMIYDTGDENFQASIVYQSAQRDGASLIVGPLTKSGILAVANESMTLPWLTLNYTDAPISGAVQFGLAPEDEARAAARHALSNGRKMALAMSPDSPWGQRVVDAFSAEFSLGGGRLIESIRYEFGSVDFRKPLQRLLQLEQSRRRNRELDVVIGESTEFQPRPRADADMIFLPVSASDTRSLLPQLEFFRAGHLPTYTLSAAHSGNVDTQLENSILCDMPWVTDTHGRTGSERSIYSAIFPAVTQDQPRLFALGADAFRLVQALDRRAIGNGNKLEGYTGNLSLMPGNRIERELGCYKIRGGRPVPAT